MDFSPGNKKSSLAFLPRVDRKDERATFRGTTFPSFPKGETHFAGTGRQPGQLDTPALLTGATPSGPTYFGTAARRSVRPGAFWMPRTNRHLSGRAPALTTPRPRVVCL